MYSCRTCVYVLLIMLFTVKNDIGETRHKTQQGPKQILVIVVNRHDSAILPCNYTCSGLVTWTVFDKPHDILAQCNQTSCQSEEGFHMSHDQYLKGDLSLTITDVTYKKKKIYTCDCNRTDLCDVTLQIKASSSSVEIKPGESLVLNLITPEPVEVLYNSTGAAAPSSGKICTVCGDSLKCKPEYTQRASLISAFELRGTETSDSGDYMIRDNNNKDIIQTYTVSVHGDPPCPCRDQEAELPVWVFPVIGLLVILLVVSVMVNVCWFYKRRCAQNGVYNGIQNGQ